MKRSAKDACAAAAVVAALMGSVTACDDGGSKATSSSTSASDGKQVAPGAQGGGASPSESIYSGSPVPTPVAIPDDEQKAAHGYINAKENASSAYQKTPTSWVDEAKPYLSESFYKKLSSSDASDGRYQWDSAHQAKIKVKVTSNCTRLRDAPSTKDKHVVICTTTDMVVDEQGKTLPLSKVPPQWGHGGQMPSTQLVMSKQGDSWVVSDDVSGKAG